MWEYFTIFGLVFMTWYDNLWLKKFENFAWKNCSWLIWEVMKMRTRVKHRKSEMIKDGYHVDSVYLYVHDKDVIKQFDMLRVFREKTVNPSDAPTISNHSELNIMDFIEMCCDPDTNFNHVNPENFYLLEVNYTFDFKKYTIFYDSETNTKIRWPIYDETAIRDRPIFQGGVSSAMMTDQEDSDNGKNATNEIRKIAGPMQNFYDDTEYVIKREWIFDDYRYPKNSWLHIVDFKGEIHTMGPECEFLSFKNE